MGNTDTLNIAVRTNSTYYYGVYDDIGFLLYEPLFRYRPRRNGWAFFPASLADIEPRLAERYDVSRDGLVYTVYLRPGVKSCFGNVMTVDDVKWSWDRAFALRRQGRWSGRIAPMANENSVVVAGDHAVAFHLERPNVTFPHILTSKYIPILDSIEVKKHATPDDPWAVEWLRDNHAGFGPFIVDRYDRENDVVDYRARHDYWCDGYPLIERLVMRGVPAVEERFRLLRSGDMDVVMGLPPAEFLALAKDMDVETLTIPSHDPVLLQMNTRTSPLNDKNVRLAISHSIDYEAIRNDIWKGLVRPLKSPIVDACLGYTDELFKYDMDVEKARTLLGSPAAAVRRPLELLYDRDHEPALLETAESIRGSLELSGFEVELRGAGEHEFRTAAFSRKFDLLLDPHGHVVPDAYYCSIDDYGDDKWGIQNFTGYANPELFRLQSDCLQARSESERIGYVREIQRVILEDAPAAYLFLNNSLIATSASVTGVEWDVNGRIFYHNVHKM